MGIQHFTNPISYLISETSTMTIMITPATSEFNIMAKYPQRIVEYREQLAAERDFPRKLYECLKPEGPIPSKTDPSPKYKHKTYNSGKDCWALCCGHEAFIFHWTVACRLTKAPEPERYVKGGRCDQEWCMRTSNNHEIGSTRLTGVQIREAGKGKPLRR